MHDGSGNLFPYIELVRNFTLDQPLYGISVHDPQAYIRTNPETLIQEKAAQYIKALRTIQPEGPYNIGGYCLGGMLAFEMGRQLTAKGEVLGSITAISSFQLPFAVEDEIFILFYLFVKEMSIPSEKVGFAFDDVILMRLFNELMVLKDNDSEKEPMVESVVTVLQQQADYHAILTRYQELKNMAPLERLRLVYEAAHSSLARFSFMKFSEFKDMYATYKVSLTATMLYQPIPYPAPLTVLRPSGWEYIPNNADFWNRIATRGFDLFDIPGNHRTCLEYPQVISLIEYLHSAVRNQ